LQRHLVPDFLLTLDCDRDTLDPHRGRRPIDLFP
jgi:hypothetical protein